MLVVIVGLAIPRPVHAQDSPLPFGTRAVFEFSPKCIRGYLPTYPTWTRYIDMYFDNQVIRVFPDQSEKWTCYDSNDDQHEAYRSPGRTVPVEMDTYLIMDMRVEQCPLGGTLTFLRPGQIERNFRVVLTTGQRGQMVLYDPQ